MTRVGPARFAQWQRRWLAHRPVARAAAQLGLADRSHLLPAVSCQNTFAAKARTLTPEETGLNGRSKHGDSNADRMPKEAKPAPVAAALGSPDAQVPSQGARRLIHE
jgi:hypothetical protein